MSKRFDNKKLLILLGVLALILVLTYVVKIPKEKSTLKSTLVELDTTAVAKIVVTPKAMSGLSFEFVKDNGNWTVRQGNIISNPADGAIRNIFESVLSAKPQSLAAVNESGWATYEVTDSLATNLKFLDARGKKLADILIGKFSYKQVQNPYNPYGGNNISGTSFVRLEGEDEVYAVEGFLSLSVGGTFNDWRDKTFIRCNSEDITRLAFTFPGDSSYVLAKKDTVWFAGTQKADSAGVAIYLSSLSFTSGQEIKDGFTPSENPVYQLAVEGNNLLKFGVKCYAGSDGEDFILTSDLNPGVYFVSKRDGIFSQVFKSAGQFLKK